MRNDKKAKIGLVDTLYIALQHCVVRSMRISPLPLFHKKYND